MAGNKLFDYLNSINYSKKDIMNDNDNSDYNAFIINKGLSYNLDTVLYANEMNMRHHISKRMQYDYLRNSIRPKKRFSKWIKKDNIDGIDLVKQYYNISEAKAVKILELLTESDIEYIKNKLNKGGINK